MRRYTKPKKKYECGKSFTKEEIVDYLRKNDFRSRDLLEERRKEGDPSAWDCQKVFGSWEKAKEAAFVSPEERVLGPLEIDEEYLVNTIIQKSLWTFEEFLEAHRKEPDLVPSTYYIRKYWGTFTNLVGYARARSIEQTMTSYYKLRNRLGRRPTLDDCKDAGIDIKVAVKLFGGKIELDKFFDYLEEVSNETIR